MITLGLWIAWKRTRDTEEKILEESKHLSEEFSEFEKFISKEFINKMVVAMAWGINLFLIGSTIAISVILYDYHQAISVYPNGEMIACCGVVIALSIDLFRLGCELYFFYVKYPKLDKKENVLLEYANTFTLGKYKNAHLLLDQVHTVIFTMLSVYAFFSLDV